MDWLKDKKNLPIVVGLAVFVLLAAGGLVAFETGLFGGGAPAPTPVVTRPVTPGAIPPGPPAGALGSVPPGSTPPGSTPPGMTPNGFGANGPARTPPGGTQVASALPNPALTNPAVGPDPFKIAGGQKILTQRQNSDTSKKNSLTDILPPFNLFKLKPPAPPPAPERSSTGPSPSAVLASNYKLIGVVTSGSGISAILETGGQSQSVKAGDSLPDGSRVFSIQPTSITLRAPGGGNLSVPLSNGSGPGGFSPNGQDANPGNFPGQPFDANGGA